MANTNPRHPLNHLRFFAPKIQQVGEEIWDMGFRPSSPYQMSKLIELHLYTGDRDVTYYAAIAGIDMQELRSIVQSGQFSLENIKATADLSDTGAAIKTPFPQKGDTNFKDAIKKSSQRLG